MIRARVLCVCRAFMTNNAITLDSFKIDLSLIKIHACVKLQLLFSSTKCSVKADEVSAVARRTLRNVTSINGFYLKLCNCLNTDTDLRFLSSGKKQYISDSFKMRVFTAWFLPNNSICLTVTRNLSKIKTKIILEATHLTSVQRIWESSQAILTYCTCKSIPAVPQLISVLLLCLSSKKYGGEFLIWGGGERTFYKTPRFHTGFQTPGNL